MSLSSWCIASLYICHFSSEIDFSSEKYSSMARALGLLSRGCEFEPHLRYPLVFDILNQFEKKKAAFSFLVRFFVGIFYLALVPTFEVLTLPVMKFSFFNFT